jgi:prolyl-tRNA synthetase
MRWSAAFIPTLRADPAEAEAPSHRLLLRGGFIRQLGAGLYSLLPMGHRVLRRIEAIVRQEMEGIGGQEFRLPTLHPAEPWKESGRWEQIGEEMFRLRDRRRADMCLGMTHEEIFTDLARRELRSYRDLPQIWFQIQTKFRDEPRPKAGVLRAREFTMKDSYSFDASSEGLDRSFELHRGAYQRIFARCGLDAIAVEAYSGTMGGSESVEFTSFSDAGEDWVARCTACGYAANLEMAVSRAAAVADPAGTGPPEKFPTPGVRTIAELAAFAGGAPAERQMKTLVYMADGRAVLRVLRGDHELNEVKAAAAVQATELRPAHPEEIRAALGASAGSLGAVGVKGLSVYVDRALEGRRGMTTGANEDGFHLRNVDVARDLAAPRFVDLRNAVAGDGCPRCGVALELRRSIEVGHIFKLGLHYSKAMGANVLSAEGQELPIVMGCYGIGMTRLLAAIAEVHCDADGLLWPASVAPFDVVVTPVKASDPAQAEAAEKLYAELAAAGLDVLLDDRDERPGVKFKDSDLVGIPWRIVLGPRTLGAGKAELVERPTRKSEEIPLDAVAAEVRRRREQACNR